MSIRVYIERVILEGIPVDHTRGLRKAMERELTRLFSEGGLRNELRGGGALPQLRAGAITLDGGRHPQRLGTQLAGAVYRGIGAPK